MAEHEDLLRQGPREAPDPETAEERSRRLGMKTAAGGVVAAGAVAAKLGALSKLFLWLVAWHGVVDLWRLGGWIAIVLALAAVTLFVALRARSED
jgi:hypothetical protein